MSTTQGSNWRELETDLPGQPVWLAPGLHPLNPAFTSGAQSLFFPTAAVDGAGRLGTTFYTSDPSTNTQVHVLFRGNFAPLDPNQLWQPAFDSSAQAITPVFSVPNTSTRSLGDYQAIAVGSPTQTCGTAATLLAATTKTLSGTPNTAQVGTRTVMLSSSP